MTGNRHPDPFAHLLPPETGQLPTAWHHLRVPGPPPALRLRADEIDGPPAHRFRRRRIMTIDTDPAHDSLALIDKAAPHARFDLMLSETSDRDKSTPDAVLPLTGRALWRSALEFVRYLSDPDTLARFGLDGGRLALACNCDPNTTDRPSVQGAKQFHLHLLYWTAQELAALHQPQPASATRDPRERRQLLDPLSILSGPILSGLFADDILEPTGGKLIREDRTAWLRGERPPGCLIELPGWEVLETPEFERLVRQIHLRISQLSATVQQAVTGHVDQPPPWRRHSPRPKSKRHGALSGLSLTDIQKQLLIALTDIPRTLPADAAEQLRHASPATQRHCMTLNQPCYGLNLYTPQCNTSDQPVRVGKPLYLLLTAKLFSGIGCAGLLPLGSVASVRILRGQGEFTPAAWRERAAWQRGFALHLRAALADSPGLRSGSCQRLTDFDRGWHDDHPSMNH